MIRILLMLITITCGATQSSADMMRMAVTTSFNNSGLSEKLLPAIQADLGLEVQLLIVGTGQAIRLGEAGDVDAILVHSQKAEEAFVAAGYGTHRREIMYNDFVIIGPTDDPANIAGAQSAAAALSLIATTGSLFISRGDDSGTHKKELSLWALTGIVADDFGPWYSAVGAGMGASLNTAAGMGAYILSDRASWLNFKNKAGLAIQFSGDPMLFNQYAYLPVNSQRHPHVNHDLAIKLETWLTSRKAAEIINTYTIDDQTLFTFNAR
jgi:tungstate transport system substrate-binding protein